MANNKNKAGTSIKNVGSSNSDNVLIYKAQCMGSSVEFDPTVALTGFEKIEGKDDKRFHELMRELRCECKKLEVNFKAQVYKYSDMCVSSLD